jgi:hypothetical protein
VQRLKDIEAELNTIDTDTLETEENEIRKNLRNPASLDTIEKKFRELRAKVKKRDEYRKTAPGLSDLV